MTSTIARNLIGGAWRDSAGDETYATRNPMRPDEIVAEYPLSTVEDAEVAIATASEAATSWAATPPAARGAVLAQAARAVSSRTEQIAEAITAEMGKPIREARVEAARAATVLEYYAGEHQRSFGDVYRTAASGALAYTLRRPLGVVGLITPWNFPCAIPAYKVAPALAFGNTAVLKLATEAPGAGVLLTESLVEAGLPAGVLNVVIGSGRVVGEAIVRDPRVAAISFTGSVEVGRSIVAASGLGRRVQLELGGHNPLIVLDDADLDAAVEAAFSGAFWSAGQRCTATRRLLVQGGVYDRFRAALLARIADAKVGDPASAETEIGPVVSATALDEILDAVDRAVAAGARVIAGGARVIGDGHVMAPTLLESDDHDNVLAQEEVFGPVASLFRVADLEQAIGWANAVPFGLSASLFTNDLRAVDRFEQQLQAGVLRVNCPTAGTDFHLPAGGHKQSGHGPPEQGRAGIEFYTESVSVYRET